MSKKQIPAHEGDGVCVERFIAGREVSEAQVAWLRREVFSDCAISREAADKLFQIEQSGGDKCPAWTEFFVETITEHVVWQQRPTGIVSEAEAGWLLARADESKSIVAIALLVNVLRESHRAPAWFSAAVRGRAKLGWPGVAEALRAA